METGLQLSEFLHTGSVQSGLSSAREPRNSRLVHESSESKRIGLLSRQAFRECLQMVIPYFTGVGTRVWAWLLIVLLVALVILDNYLYSVWVDTHGNIMTSLSKKHCDEVRHGMFILFLVLAAWVVIVAGKHMCLGTLKLEWRRFATSSIMNTYLHEDHQPYYRFQFEGEGFVDNPDQRICEDIREFTLNFVEFFSGMFDAIVTGVVFVPLLWRTSPTISFFVLCFGPLLTMVHLGIFGTRLAHWTRAALRQEATLRFSLIRARENSESIAFLHGESRELKHCQKLFESVLSTMYRRLMVFVTWNTFKHATLWFTYLIPMAILGPQICTGHIEMGALDKARGSFGAVLEALSYIVDHLDQISEVAAEATRVSTLVDALASNEERTGMPEAGQGIRFYDCFEVTYDEIMQVQNLWLWPPTCPVAERAKGNAILSGLSFSIKTGQSLIITGRSGVGKTSLLRAVCGLWLCGNGTVNRCPTDCITFQPQHPYMCLGTLREQVLYPRLSGTVASDSCSDQDIELALAKVNLGHLVDRYGLHSEFGFSHALSLGEQQRLSFSRLLLRERLRLILLDEATSALDEHNERMLYELLGETVGSFISVGHRGTLRQFHTHELHLRRLPSGECIGSKEEIFSSDANRAGLWIPSSPAGSS